MPIANYQAFIASFSNTIYKRNILFNRIASSFMVLYVYEKIRYRATDDATTTATISHTQPQHITKEKGFLLVTSSKRFTHFAAQCTNITLCYVG